MLNQNVNIVNIKELDPISRETFLNTQAHLILCRVFNKF